MHSDPWNWPNLHPGNLASGYGMRSTDRSYQAHRSKIHSIYNVLIERLVDRIAPGIWLYDARSNDRPPTSAVKRKPLYTPAERLRRDSTGWTLVQGILAPIQFAVFLVSLALVLNYLLTGQGYGIAAGSVVVKTLVLYAIMITGAIWEKRVFGKYLFAEAFFWEDAVSMLVIGLHTAYLAAILSGFGSAHDRMILALAAYLTYAINATQFLLKLRAARLEAPRPQGAAQ
jgi:3-vinyl bacteriochlorophyllide hydratase